MKRLFYIYTKDAMDRRWRVVGIFLVLICLIMTVGLWLLLEESNRALSASRLTNDKEIVIDTMERRLEVYSDVLYGGRALFLIEPELTRNSWDAYMETQNLSQRYPGLNSVTYLEVADESTVDDLYASINEQRRAGEQRIEPLPTMGRDKMVIAKYASQVNGYRVVGRNAYDRDYLVNTLDRAAVAAVPIASPAFDSPNPNRAGTKDILIFLAVYDRTFKPTMSNDEKRASLQGFVAASVHPRTVFEQGITSLSDPETIHIYVNEINGGEVYEFNEPLTIEQLSIRTGVNVAGQSWYVTVSAPATYDLSPRQVFAPVFFLITGLVFMVILVNLFFYWTGVRFSRKPPTQTQSK